MNERTAPHDDTPIPLVLVERGLDTEQRAAGSVPATGPWPYLACPGARGADPSAAARGEQREMSCGTHSEREDVG